MIAPGDATPTLRSGILGCPFIGIAGRSYPVGLVDGAIWDSTVDSPASTAARSEPTREDRA